VAVDLEPSPDAATPAERTAVFIREVVIGVDEEHSGVVTSEQVRARRVLRRHAAGAAR